MLSTTFAPSQVNVTKSSSKLGITIPQLSQSANPARTVVRLTIANQSGQACFLALAAPWITIPAKICTKLNIVYDQVLSVLELKPIQPHTRLPFKTLGDTVDMLSLIPPTSTNGNEMYVDEFEEHGQAWLRVWYCHPRGAARQIELKRYADAAKLGQLLGLLQAEEDKHAPRVGFKNSNIAEHGDLISGLLELGVQPTLMHGRCVFNPNKSTLETAHEFADHYRKLTGITIEHFNAVQEYSSLSVAITMR